MMKGIEPFIQKQTPLMINPVYNHNEERMRAGIRIMLYIFIVILLMGLPSLLPFPVMQYVVTGFLVVGFSYVAFRYMDKRSWSEAGLTINKRWWEDCAAGILMAAVAMGLIFLVQLLTGTITFEEFAWNQKGMSFWLWPVGVFMIQMMSVGLYEEVISRSYLLTNLTEGFRFKIINPAQAVVIAIIISSGIFAFAHAANPNASMTAVLNIFIAGVMLAVPYILTGSLALSVGIHFSWNFFQGGVFGFPVSGMSVRRSVMHIQQGGENWWTGGNFGPEAGVIGVLGMLFILLCIVIYIKKREQSLSLDAVFAKNYQEKQVHASEG